MNSVQASGALRAQLVLEFIEAVIVYRTVCTIMMAQSAQLSRGVLGVDAELLASITSSIVLLVIISLMEMVFAHVPCI